MSFFWILFKILTLASSANVPNFYLILSEFENNSGLRSIFSNKSYDILHNWHTVPLKENIICVYNIKFCAVVFGMMNPITKCACVSINKLCDLLKIFSKSSSEIENYIVFTLKNTHKHTHTITHQNFEQI